MEEHNNMGNKSITFTAVGAFSYAWNKGEDKESCLCVRICSSIVATLIAIFRGYTVSEKDAKSIYRYHTESIFAAEYDKEMENRKISNHFVIEDEMTSNKEQDVAKKQEKSTTAEEAVSKDCETPSSATERTDLSSLLAGKEIKICSADEFKELMFQDNFSDDIHYVVTSAVSLYFTKKPAIKIGLPKFLTMEGPFSIRHEVNLKTLPVVLIAKGFVSFTDCPGLTDLSSTHIIADGDLWFDYCKNITCLPNKIVVDGTITISKCLNLTTLPDGYSYGALDIISCFSLSEDISVKAGDPVKVAIKPKPTSTEFAKNKPF